jgi:hypothetical protein
MNKAKRCVVCDEPKLGTAPICKRCRQKRRKLQKEKAGRGKSRSIRAVSGGLPSLGKRR